MKEYQAPSLPRLHSAGFPTRPPACGATQSTLITMDTSGSLDIPLASSSKSKEYTARESQPIYTECKVHQFLPEIFHEKGVLPNRVTLPSISENAALARYTFKHDSSGHLPCEGVSNVNVIAKAKSSRSETTDVPLDIRHGDATSGSKTSEEKLISIQMDTVSEENEAVTHV